MTALALRTCTRCEKQFPLVFFNKDRSRPDGVYPQCKDCSRQACKRVYKKHYDRHVATKRRWKAENPERHKEINRQWQIDNPEKVRAYTNHWRARNPEKARRWGLENPERVREIERRWKTANREKILETERRYIANNPGKMRAKNARRRANLLRATPAWVDHEILEFIYSECPAGWHVDHVHPLKGRNSCGLHVPWNLQYLPAALNLRKSNKAPAVQEARSYL